MSDKNVDKKTEDVDSNAQLELEVVRDSAELHELLPSPKPSSTNIRAAQDVQNFVSRLVEIAAAAGHRDSRKSITALENAEFGHDEEAMTFIKSPEQDSQDLPLIHVEDEHPPAPSLLTLYTAPGISNGGISDSRIPSQLQMTGSNLGFPLVGDPISNASLFTPSSVSSIVPASVVESQSQWEKFHSLTHHAFEDDRYEARKIAVFKPGDTSSTTSEEDNDKISRMSMILKPEEHGRLSTLIPNAPFVYMYRPFRKPHLATKQTDEICIGSDLDLPLHYPYSFSPVNVGSYEWISIPHGSDTYLTVKQWQYQEPAPPYDSLPPEVDPMVRYQLERRGISGDQLSHNELQRIQEEIELKQTPSGRKLKGYFESGDGEQCIFERVQCRDQPGYNTLNSVDTGDGDKWPDPSSIYWDYKKLESGLDDHYARHSKSGSTHRKLKRLEELESNPLSIPNFQLDHDTDTSASSADPEEDSKGPRVTKPQDNPFSLRWRFNEVREPVTDPVVRRYPYLYLHLQGKYYNKFYLVKRAHQNRKRKLYGAYQRFFVNNNGLQRVLDGLNPCNWPCFQNSWKSHPIWFRVWKSCLRHGWRRVPREWKFLDESKTQTIFYGTLASLYETQYIVEHDVFPNLDDPVHCSQVALLKAMAIKEKYLSHRGRGSEKTFVDYLKLQRSKSYEQYLHCIGLLCRYQPIKMPDRVRKVFFLNFFNVLSIQTQIWRIPEVEKMKYLWEMSDFWEKTKGLAGYIELSLEEIYHGILRCNRPHPFKQVPVFKEPAKGLPKELHGTRLSLDCLDPRIHFALNIGCKLEEVAKAYIRSRVKIDADLRVVHLPILFLWYEKDFGNHQRVLLWYLRQFMLAKDALKIRKLVTSKRTIFFHYEPFDDTLDPIVRRFEAGKCPELVAQQLPPAQQRKCMTLYWDGRF